jgi:hypothetical protein
LLAMRANLSRRCHVSKPTFPPAQILRGSWQMKSEI